MKVIVRPEDGMLEIEGPSDQLKVLQDTIGRAIRVGEARCPILREEGVGQCIVRETEK